MNEGRLFLYVNPKIVLPGMFLVLIVTALLVHASILYNTTWFAAIWEGGAAKAPVAAAAAAPAAATAAPAVADTAAPAANAAQ